MARIFIDGFETGGLELWNTGYTTVVSSSGLNMDGDYCMKADASERRQKILDTTYPALYFAFLYRPWEVGSESIMTFCDSAGTTILTVQRNVSSGLVKIRRGDHESTLLETGDQALNPDTTYLMEIYYKPLDVSGECTIKIDGIVDATYSGDTTNGLEEIKSFKMGVSDRNCAAYFDNLIIDDASWIGNSRIQAIVPTGAGTTTEWTPSTGANWECVDEKPPSDADYVSVNAVDKIDLYEMGDMAGIVESIKCVQVQARCAYEGVPTPTHIQLACRSGGNNYFSVDKSPPISFGIPVCKIWETDPATGVAWIKAGVDAAEFGEKTTA